MPDPDMGLNGIPDRALFTAIKNFQTDQGLSPTGAIKPGDETEEKLSAAATAKKNGKYIWRTVGDDRVRPGHAALNGTVRDLSDSPDPGEEINCRCWAVPIPKRKPEQKKNVCDEIAAQIERVTHLLEELSKLHTKNDEKIAQLEVKLDLAKEKQRQIELRKALSYAPRLLEDTLESNDAAKIIGGLNVGVQIAEDPEVIAARQEVGALQNAIEALKAEQRALEEKIQNLERELMTLELQQTENCD